jgi:hypothetical protein
MGGFQHLVGGTEFLAAAAGVCGAEFGGIDSSPGVGVDDVDATFLQQLPQGHGAGAVVVANFLRNFLRYLLRFHAIGGTGGRFYCVFG